MLTYIAASVHLHYVDGHVIILVKLPLLMAEILTLWKALLGNSSGSDKDENPMLVMAVVVVVAVSADADDGGCNYVAA